jgi:CRP-like cAMP-binding protein
MYVQMINSIDLFSGISEEDTLAICSQVKFISVAKRTLLLNRSDYLAGMYGVVSGKLKIYLLSCSGQERIIRILEPGDHFGEAIMFNGIPSPVFVEALCPSELLFFPKDSVSKLLELQPDFAHTMLTSMSFLLKELLSDLESCCLQGAVQRIAYYLYQRKDDNNSLELPSTKSDVASLLNLTAESLSRGLHQLSNQGLISLFRRKIVIEQPDLLKNIAYGELKLTDLTTDNEG